MLTYFYFFSKTRKILPSLHDEFCGVISCWRLSAFISVTYVRRIKKKEKKKKTSFVTRSDHIVRLHIIIIYIYIISHHVRYKLIRPGRALQSQFVNNRMAGGNNLTTSPRRYERIRSCTYNCYRYKHTHTHTHTHPPHKFIAPGDSVPFNIYNVETILRRSTCRGKSPDLFVPLYMTGVREKKFTLVFAGHIILITRSGQRVMASTYFC